MFFRHTAGMASRPGPLPTVAVRLATRPPFAGGPLLAFLAARALPGIEAVDGATYRRTIDLPHGPGVVAMTVAADHVDVRATVADPADGDRVEAVVRGVFDLDTDPAPIEAVLGADPLLAPLVAATPGRRNPGCVDGGEILLRAIVGQQVSVAGARTVVGRVAAALGAPLPAALAGSTDAQAGALTHRFPTAARVAAADPATLPLPATRATALVTALGLVADGTIDLRPGADGAAARSGLLAVHGIGEWTASYVAMRALGDPDVFLPTDVAVLRGLAARGGPSDRRGAAQAAERWAPWRTYALHHLWSAS